MERTSDYVCVSCGVKYLTEEQKKGEGHVSTFHTSECGVCNERKPVTHIRHYNWLRTNK